MFKLDDPIGLDTICDECESFGLTSKISDHDSKLIEYYCYDCKAEWVEYV